MKKPLVQYPGGVTLVGGGPLRIRDLHLSLGLAPHIVAADGGADRLLAAGLMPDAVMGDLDSLSAGARALIPQARVFGFEDQDSTDFDKALRSVKAPFILALGFSGGRSDHSLAAMNALVRYAERPCLVLGPKDISFALPPGRFEILLRKGDLFSLFPFARMRGKSQGLVWPLDRHDFAPDGFIATSNAVSSGPVTLDFTQKGMVAILPRNRLKAAITALTSRAL